MPFNVMRGAEAIVGLYFLLDKRLFDIEYWFARGGKITTYAKEQPPIQEK